MPLSLEAGSVQRVALWLARNVDSGLSVEEPLREGYSAANVEIRLVEHIERTVVLDMTDPAADGLDNRLSGRLVVPLIAVGFFETGVDTSVRWVRIRNFQQSLPATGLAREVNPVGQRRRRPPG